MRMLRSPEQVMLADSVGAFLSNKASIPHLRALRDGEEPAGFDLAAWREFSALGYNGIMVPEEFGGLGLGHVESGIVLEAMGRNLTLSPFLTTAVGAATAIAWADRALRREWLPRIAQGQAVGAIALEESVRHRPYNVACELVPSGDGFILRGEKRFVLHGHVADFLIVTARSYGAIDEPDGLTVLLVETETSGIGIAPERLADSGVAAWVTFSDVKIGPEAIIGGIGAGRPVLDAMLAALRCGAAAELAGVGGQALATSLVYLKDRKQFGREIGSFQALQHRAAHLHAEMEAARAAVLKAQLLLDDADPAADRATTVAKGMAGLASALAVQEGVQMHGGIGMTDECDIGLYMKRQRVLAELFGDTDYHADRLARQSGY